MYLGRWHFIIKYVTVILWLLRHLNSCWFYNFPSWLQFWKVVSDKCFVKLFSLYRWNAVPLIKSITSANMWLNGPTFVLDVTIASNQNVLKSISCNFTEHISTFHIYFQWLSSSINPFVSCIIFGVTQKQLVTNGTLLGLQTHLVTSTKC